MDGELLYGKHYWRAAKARHSSLRAEERDRCFAAVRTYCAHARHPGLNLERLGDAPRNHWSIRASRELRVILAIEHDDSGGTVTAAVNMGHHDAMYDWSKRHDFHTDLADPDQVLPPDSPALVDQDARDAAVPPTDFEEWMLFLPEPQRRLANRRFAGPARIRGAAGTGKSVIALHRAAALARRYTGERILFTTYVRSLRGYLEWLFKRLPDAPGNVEFGNIDQIAYRCCEGEAKKLIDEVMVDQAFAAAWRAVVPGSTIEQLGRDYLRDEIQLVIKGRDAAREDYLDTDRFERLGRKRSLRRRERALCWDLREAWDREIRQRCGNSFPGTFVDRLKVARDHVRARGEGVFRAAIVDEAQDMPLVGMQLVRALVAGAPENDVPADGVLMVDDAAQRIYAGGFRPAWAGLDFSGRSEVLRVNYRNDRAIFEAAAAIRGDGLIAREDNNDGATAAPEFERAEGARPVFLRVSVRGEAPAILERITRLVEGEGFRYEEIAVLTQRKGDADALTALMIKRGIPCFGLSKLRDGPPGPGVRLGTFDRAKGLEFRAVFIPRLGGSYFPEYLAEDTGAPSAALGEEETEARLLQLDRLYVAMTRARERLYLIADEAPCAEIDAAWEHFDHGDAAIGA